MSYHIVENYTGKEPLPVREDGEKWTHALLSEGALFLADTASELIDIAIEEGYGQIPEGEEGDEQALLARLNIAIEYARMIQLDHMKKYVEEHQSFDDVPEDVIHAATTPRSQPIPLDTPTWTGPFALVAIATDYDPYRKGVKVPKGEVILVDPFTETTLLQTLAAAGVFHYRIHEDAGSN